MSDLSIHIKSMDKTTLRDKMTFRLTWPNVVIWSTLCAKPITYLYLFASGYFYSYVQECVRCYNYNYR
jgi:hypothetical protein